MKEEGMIRQFFDQVARSFTVASILICIVGIWFNDEPIGFSRLFGQGGLRYEGIFQILIIALVSTFLQIVFLSERVIKKVSYAKCMIGFMSSAFFSITALIVLWGWFPIDSGLAWLCFLVSYGVSLLISILIFGRLFRCKEKEYEKLLDKYQKKQEVKKDDY